MRPYVVATWIAVGHWMEHRENCRDRVAGVRRQRRAVVVSMAVFAAALPMAALAHEPSEAAKQRMLDGGPLDYIGIGAEHMLTGYDHLLFLIGVLFFLSRPLQIVQFITAFTIGHTVTLLFGTLLSIQVNHFLIDAVIALTVIYKAFENLDGFPRLVGIKAPPLVLMIFGFGLIHGLGLSTRLQEMTLVNEPGLVSRILWFNVGVELGQVVALLAMGMALSVWRGTPGWKRFSVLANSVLIAGGVLLFGLQIHGYFDARSAGTPTSSHSAPSLLHAKDAS